MLNNILFVFKMVRFVIDKVVKFIAFSIFYIDLDNKVSNKLTVNVVLIVNFI